MRAHPMISSFNGGELSPLLGGRPDAEKYQAGLSLSENFIPRVQGALVRRGGTRFVGAVKAAADRCWLLRFEYSVTDAFVLELGHRYMRFYRNHGVFEDTPGHTYEITTPWSAADLTAEDGSLALRYVQSGDVIYFAHRKHPPQKLVRVSNTDWRLQPLEFKGGPFKDQNITETTVQTSGITGDITVTASDSIFTTKDVGSLFYIEMQDASGITPWFAGSKVDGQGAAGGVALGSMVTSDGKYYACSTAPGPAPVVTGSVQPIHSVGKAWDGDGLDDNSNPGVIGVEWEYLHSGYGWVKITGLLDGQNVTAQVLSDLPDAVQYHAPPNGAKTRPTKRWAKAAWSDAEDWPSCVTFFRQRLTFARDQRLWFSVAGDYENFAARPFDEILPDSAMNLLIASARGDVIQWLAPVDKLLVGTGGTVFAIGESTTTQPFGPVGPNARSEDQGLGGSNGVGPVVAPGAVLAVHKSGRMLSEIGPSSDSTGYGEVDLTVFAEHITRPGIVDLTFVKQPHSMVMAALDEGALRGFTYMKAQGVSGWHRHVIAGGSDGQAGIVESVVSIPSPDGRRDDLWMIVKRHIDGADRRYVEVMTPEYREGDDPALSAYGDASVLYQGAAVSTLGGLQHLEGMTVSLKVNGAAHPDRVVSGGQVHLAVPATRAVAGLAAPAKARLMALEAGADGGTAQGRPKRINRLTVRLLDSLGGRFGPDFDRMEALQYRTAVMPMDAPPPLFTGDRVVEFPGDYDGAATIAVECDGEFPFTLVAMVPEVVGYGG